MKKTSLLHPLFILTGLAILNSGCTLSFALVGAGIDSTRAKAERTVDLGDFHSLEQGNMIVIYTYDQLALTGRFQEASPISLSDDQSGILIRRNEDLVHIPWYRIEKVGVLKEQRNTWLIGALAGATLDALLIYQSVNKRSGNSIQ
ncbi:MAG: hypothetical protein HRU12_12470 [Phaeodactylibacter sp.]|nr:hypothetical protein [Phaeodactylibacter sp.]